jgi:hypothetical protein
MYYTSVADLERTLPEEATITPSPMHCGERPVPVGFSWEDRWLMTRKPGLWRRWGSYRPAKSMLFWACVACTIATMVIGFNGVDG